MSSPNPVVRKAMTAGNIGRALSELELTEKEEFHGELRAEGDDLRRAIEQQLKALKEKPLRK